MNRVGQIIAMDDGSLCPVWDDGTPEPGTVLYAPPPAAPVSMAELEKALDDALGEAWRRGATGCHPAGEMVLRAHVLRLASAGVVATVSREAFVAAYSELFNSDDPSALRALGIEVKE